MDDRYHVVMAATAAPGNPEASSEEEDEGCTWKVSCICSLLCETWPEKKIKAYLEPIFKVALKVPLPNSQNHLLSKFPYRYSLKTGVFAFADNHQYWEPEDEHN